MRLKSHFRWAFFLAILELFNEAVPFATFLLGTSNIAKDLIIYTACLILPAIYYYMIVYSWVKLRRWKGT